MKNFKFIPREFLQNNKVNAIHKLIENFKTNLTDYHSWVDKTIGFLEELPALSIIAREPCISTAHQSGLMFKEATKIPAFGILGGEFRHGHMEMVQKGLKGLLQNKVYRIGDVTCLPVYLPNGRFTCRTAWQARFCAIARHDIAKAMGEVERWQRDSHS